MCNLAGRILILQGAIKPRSSKRCSVKKRVLKNFEKRLWQRCFPVNITKFLRTAYILTPLVAASENLYW